MVVERFSFEPSTLTNIIKTRYFAVPRYQRSYAWNDDQVSDFWNDMLEAIKDGGDYFLGNIVLTPGKANADNGESLFSIIDGQQRIATTTLLFAAMKRIYEREGEQDLAYAIRQEMLYALDTSSGEKVVRIRMNEIDNPFFEKIIIDEKEPEPKTDSHRLISKAYNNFFKKLESIVVKNPANWKKRFLEISKYFKSQARIVSVNATNDADAFTIFETLNDRGIGLSIADLLKNYLYSKAGEKIDTAQHNWVETKTVLEEYQDEKDFIIFLRHYWSSVHGMTREKDLYRDIKEKVRTKKEATELSNNLVQASRYYVAALSEQADFWKGYSNTHQNNVKLLLRLKLEQNRPLLIAVFQHFDKKEIQKTVPALVSWSVRGLIGGVMGKGAAEKAFCEAAVKIRNGEVATKTQLASELSKLIPKDSAFVAEFENYRTRNNAFARYLLLAIERHLIGEEQPEHVPNENVDQVNLEHVLPQKAKPTEWGNFSPDEVTFYSLRLGNMTLLQEKKNNKLGNRAFVVKQPVLEASEMKLNSTFADKSSWGKSDIEQRQKYLAGLAPEVWKL